MISLSLFEKHNTDIFLHLIKDTLYKNINYQNFHIVRENFIL